MNMITGPVYACGRSKYIVALPSACGSTDPGSHVSSVHGLRSSQLTGVSTQRPRSSHTAVAQRLCGPHAVPADHYSATTPRRPFVLALVIDCILVVGLSMGLLRWSLDTRLEATYRDLAAARSGAGAVKDR